MKYKKLQSFAETCQEDADRLSFLLMKARNLMILQSICDFNIWWLHDVSPLALRQPTIDFLVNYVDKFKRKITAKEMMFYDAIIYSYEPGNFNEFKNLIK